MRRISLCLIARDEAQLLAGCLASVAGAVDEVVLVDTGSTDGTGEVARRAGVRVVPFAWRDDFAAARNASLAAATGDWVLVLDADERLAPGAARTIRTAVRCPAAPAGALRLHDASRLDATAEEVLSGRARLGDPIELPRLLRRDRDLAYEGVVHEHVSSWLNRNGAKVMPVGADVIHLGAVPALRHARGKRERNVTLLRRRWEADPGDLAAAGYLAQDLYGAGAYAEANRVVDQAWPRRADSTAFLTRRLAVARALLARVAHDPERVLETVADEEARQGRHPELAFLRGCAREEQAASEPPGSGPRQQRLREAEADFREAVSEYPHRLLDSVYGARSWLGHTRLGTVLLLLGRPSEASEAFRAALQARPGDREAELGLAEAELARGDALAALRRLEPMLDEVRDAWWLAARAAAAAGSPADAALLAERTRSDPTRFIGWHRAEQVRAALRPPSRPATAGAPAAVDASPAPSGPGGVRAG